MLVLYFALATGEDNSGHFFVGTQDKQLHKDIAKVPAGVSLFMSANGLHLEQPSQKQEQLMRQASLTKCPMGLANYLQQAAQACHSSVQGSLYYRILLQTRSNHFACKHTTCRNLLCSSDLSIFTLVIQL